MLQKSNWDFMNPIRIQLTYDLTDVGEPTVTSRNRVPDINNYPVVNKAKAEKNFSVSISCSFISYCIRCNLSRHFDDECLTYYTELALFSLFEY